MKNNNNNQNNNQNNDTNKNNKVCLKLALAAPRESRDAKSPSRGTPRPAPARLGVAGGRRYVLYVGKVSDRGK